MNKSLAAAALCLSLFALPGSAAAATISFNLNEYITGTAPNSTQPWFTLTFEDIVAGTVRLTATADLNITNEFIDQFVFNVAPSIDPTAVSFAFDASRSTTGFGAATITKGNNTAALIPVTGFDFMFDYPNANNGGGVQRLNNLEVAVYTVTCTGDLDCASFNAQSFNHTTAATGPLSASYFAAVYYQGITTGDGTGKFGETGTDLTAAPKPQSLILLGSGLVAVAFGIRRRTGIRA